MRAWSAAGASDPSPAATVTALPAGSPPRSPCCLWGSEAGYGAVALSWSDLSDNEEMFTIERDDGWGFYAVGLVGPNVTAFTDSGLQQGQMCSYRIVAENAFGKSYSEEFAYRAPYWMDW